MGDCMQARNINAATEVNSALIVRRNRCEQAPYLQGQNPPTKLLKAKSLIWVGFTTMLP
jgi:hypothetical protein